MIQDYEIAELRRDIQAMKTIYDQRLADQGEEIARLSDAVQRLLMTPFVAGTFPPIDEIDRLDAQVFHTTDLTPNKRRGGNAEWSLKLEPYHRGRRQPGINIAMMAAQRAHDVLLARDTPKEILDLVANIVANDTVDVLVGIVKHKLVNGGAAYTCDQVAIMIGHETGMEDVSLMLAVGSDAIEIDEFRPASGAREGKALWYGQYARPFHQNKQTA